MRTRVLVVVLAAILALTAGEAAPSVARPDWTATGATDMAYLALAR